MQEHQEGKENDSKTSCPVARSMASRFWDVYSCLQHNWLEYLHKYKVHFDDTDSDHHYNFVFVFTCTQSWKVPLLCMAPFSPSSDSPDTCKRGPMKKILNLGYRLIRWVCCLWLFSSSLYVTLTWQCWQSEWGLAGNCALSISAVVWSWWPPVVWWSSSHSHKHSHTPCPQFYAWAFL